MTIKALLELATKGQADVEKAAKSIDKVTEAEERQKKVTRELSGAMQSFAGPLDQVAQRGGVVSRVLGSFGPVGLAGAVGVGALTAAFTASAAAVASATKEAIAYAGTISDLAAKTGLGVMSLQKLEYAGSLVGVSLDTVAQSTLRMQKSLVDTPKVFAALELSAKELRQLAPEEALAKIAEQIQRIPDPAGKASAAMSIFGKSGAEMLPLLTSNLVAANDEFDRLGMGIKAGPLAALDELGDAGTTLERAWTGMWRQIGAAVANNPEIIRAIEGITNAIGKLARFVADHASELMLVARIIAGGLTMGVSEVLRTGARVGFGAGGAAAGGGAGAAPPRFDPRTGALLGSGVGSIPTGALLGFAAGTVRGGPLNYRSPAEIAAEEAAQKAAQKAAAAAAEAARKEAERIQRELTTLHRSLLASRVDFSQLSGRTTGFYGLHPVGDLGVSPLAGKVDFSQLSGRTTGLYAEQATKATVAWDQQLQRLANTMQSMGSITGRTGQKLAALTATIANIGGNVKDMKGGGFFDKLLGGLGIGASVVSFIGGLFGGGPSKAERAAAAKQAAEEAARAAEEARQNRIAGLGNAATSLNTFLQAGGSAQTGGVYAAGIFAGMVRETGNVVQALNALGPALQEIRKRFEETGESGSAALDHLLGMSSILDKTGMGGQISALQDLAKALGQGGIAGTPAIVGALAQDTTSQFHQLMGGGATAQDAFNIMQPMFQQLWEAQQKRPGSITDEGTLSLLQQAQDQGLVGDDLRTGVSATNSWLEKIYGVLSGGGGEQETSIYLDGDKVGSFARRAVTEGLERDTDGRLRSAVRNAQAGG